MILEALRHLLTPCPPDLRQLGYLRELIAIEARFARNRAAWAPHLAATREAVLAAAAACPRTGKATLLGSGVLLDVPLDGLLARFDEVVLVDVLHLPRVRRLVRRTPRLRLVAADITGIIQPVLAGHLPETGPPRLPEDDADLVVSLNILSQLPLPLGRRAARRHPPDAVETFMRGLIEHHLALLGNCPGRTLLISETERRWLDGGTVVEREDPLHGATLPPLETTWTWDIAPHPEADPRLDLQFRVGAGEL